MAMSIFTTRLFRTWLYAL